MTKGKRITIELSDGRTIRATVEYAHGDNITVKGEDGFIHEIDRNIRSESGAYIALF